MVGKPFIPAREVDRASLGVHDCGRAGRIGKSLHSIIGFYEVIELLTRYVVLSLLRSQGGENTIPLTTRKLQAELQEIYLLMLLNPQQYIIAVSEMEQIPKPSSKPLRWKPPFDLCTISPSLFSLPGNQLVD